jgi:hypothetical protein
VIVVAQLREVPRLDRVARQGKIQEPVKIASIASYPKANDHVGGGVITQSKSSAQRSRLGLFLTGREQL